MREIRTSSTLTIYHDGQFWVGVFEHVETGRLSACRIVFGAEPSNEELQHLVCNRWNQLRFTRQASDAAKTKVATNPKRRQRMASRELRKKGASTKAQQALAEERESQAQERKGRAREKRELEKKRQFELRRERQKRRHRGK